MKFYFWILCTLPFTLIGQSHTKITDFCVIENSEITLHGTSNVINYSCLLHDLSNNKHIEIKSEVVGRTIHLTNAIILLRSKGFNCDNKIMTDDLFKAIKGKQYPHILVEFHQFTLVQEISENPHQKNVPCKMSITLAGKTNPYHSLLSDLQVSADQLILTGSLNVLMTDFGIMPPTALFGLVKTGDEITIEYKIQFTFK